MSGKKIELASSVLKCDNHVCDWNVVCSVVGTAFEQDHWQVVCPNCQKEFEYKGYFDSSDITNCKCGTSFKTSKIEFENGSYID